MPVPSSSSRRLRGPITMIAVAAAAAGSLVGCSGEKTQEEGAVTVFAAASLTRAFEAISHEVVPAIDPTLTVNLTFEGSTTLAEQVEHGAPADVVAFANEAVMERLDKGGFVVDPTKFASNRLAIIVPEGNPDNVTGFNESLNTARLVICAPQVPCGAAAHTHAAAVGLELVPVSEEHNVNLVRTKVEQGEATAGIVYATDAAIATAVETIPHDRLFPDFPADTVYPIAMVADATNKAGAKTFIEAVTSPAGQEVLARFGFGVAP